MITGGTGMIGRALSRLLIKKGYSVIVLSRDAAVGKRSAMKGVSYAAWDVAKQTIDIDAVQKADYIIHLAGAGVADKRWSDRRKQEIVESRTKSSALLIKALQEISIKCRSWATARLPAGTGPTRRFPTRRHL